MNALLLALVVLGSDNPLGDAVRATARMQREETQKENLRLKTDPVYRAKVLKEAKGELEKQRESLKLIEAAKIAQGGKGRTEKKDGTVVYVYRGKADKEKAIKHMKEEISKTENQIEFLTPRGKPSKRPRATDN